MCEMKILGSGVLWRIFGTLLQDGLTQMRGVTWGAAQAKFKTGMREMKSWGLRVCDVSLDVGSGWLAHQSGVIWRAVLAKFKTDV